MTLTEDDRFLIKRARELAREARTGDIPEQLAAQLLIQLADRVEQLAGQK